MKMKRFFRVTAALLAVVLVLNMMPWGIVSAQETTVSENTPSGTVQLPDQYIRDPFILNDDGVYYLYGSIAFGAFEVFSSTDLVNWTSYSDPAFQVDEDSWVHEASKQTVSGVETGYWAPEVFKLTIDGETAYYMIATFTQNKEPYNQQVSAIMKSSSPLGPFEPWSVDENGDIAPITPNDGCSYMDATLYYEDGVPYLVYVHEWQCSCYDYDGNGSMAYVQLSDDLKTVVGTHTEWFKAWWMRGFRSDLFAVQSPGVTDGPEVYTDANGQKYLLWSTHFLDAVTEEQVYVELATKFSKLSDVFSISNLQDNTLLLYANNGGHGMIFTDNQGNEKMILHTPSNKNARACIFDVQLTDSGIALETYTVSGTVAGNLNGTITATGPNGRHIFENALVDGSYSIQLPNGTYDLYFDCGDTDGMATATVNGGDVAVPMLSQTYQKLTIYKEGSAGTANWVMTGSGRYEVQTSNTNVNSVSMGYFAEGVDLSATDFVINTNVEAAGSNSAMIGLAISGINAGGSAETAVFGLNNANYTAQIRVMNEDLWPGYLTVSEYDRTNFHLTIVKQGTTITCYVDGVQACQWTTSDYDFGSWTETKVGLGFYRMYDVTFSDYSYFTDLDVCFVNGTVAGELNGSITVTDSNGETQEFPDALVNGSYNILLNYGTYDLYFDCGDTEGMIADVTVSDVTQTLPSLEKTYQKLTVYKAGIDGTADWVLTDNGRYEVQTSNTSVNSISMGWFVSGVNMSSTDFVIESNVEAAGSNAVMIGLAITGKNAAGSAETTVFGLNNSNHSAQIRALIANGWPGYKSVASYDRTNFHLRIVKSGTTITYYINNVQACQWTTADYDFAGWTETKVGLGFYRMFDVTFSDYSYNTLNSVSGTVAGKPSGDITVTDAEGNESLYEDALVDGIYSITLAAGVYSLYFDCGETEGLINEVTVDGNVTANLDKTYQKLTVYKEGSDGTANWVLTDNGRYEVQTSSSGGNSISMGWFVSGVDMSTTDFVIETDVEAAGTNAVMMGLAITGKNAAGSAETAVFGLNNSNYSAQIRALLANGWPGYKSVPTYDRTDFHLKIVKEGTTITYYINGTQACQWTTSDYDFAGWTETKVGLGFYRMFDVTFSNYGYTTVYADNCVVSGTVGGNSDGTITVTDADGNQQVFENALVNGSYSIELKGGTYDLYFDCGETEGMIADLLVSTEKVTADLNKTYQKLTVYKEGSAGTADWVLTDNGRYEVQTSDSGGDTVTMGYFASGVNMAETDFIINTDVEAAGNTSVMIGLAISGKNASGNAETAVFGLANNSNFAQLRTLTSNGWLAYKLVLTDYDTKGFHLTVVKNDATITYYIDGVKACEWIVGDYDFSAWTDTKVGLGFYRMQDVTFSDYSYYDGDWGISFNKEATYESVHNPTETPKTFEATVYFHTTTADTTQGGVILGSYNSQNPVSLEVIAGGKIQLSLDGNSYVFNTDLYTGKPEHIAVTLDESSELIHCYQNGTLVGSQSYDTTLTYSISDLTLGSDHRSGNSLYFRGNILTAAMFADCRTQAEICSDMFAMPTDEVLIAWYDLTDVCKSQTIADDSGNGYDMIWNCPDFFVGEEKVLGEDYAYSFAVIGDTQIMARDEVDNVYTGYFAKIYDYILDHKDSKNIQFVMGLGDITDTYGITADSTAEWELATEQIKRLDGQIPHSFIRGNHDDTEEYNQYLRYDDYKNVIGGSYEENMLNTWQELTVGQVKYLILALDFGPSDEVLEWAGQVIADHPEHNVIITTHLYLYSDGTTLDANDPHHITSTSGGTNNGDVIWDKLASKYENVVMVVCGHISMDTIVTTQAVGDNGNVVTQMLIDPQGVDAALAPTGMVAMLYFSQDGKTVSVEYYSTVQEKHYKTENIYTVELDVVPITGNVTAQNAKGQTIAGYESLATALADTEVTGIVSYQLNADLANQVISKDMILDLNGHNLTDATVDRGVNVQLIDSTTDDFTGEYGRLSGTIEGTVDSLVEFGSKSYFVACENGVYSAHRYEVKLTHVSLDPGNDALGYKAQFNGDETVCKYVTGFGFNLWVEGGSAKTFAKDGSFENGQVLSLRLKNILASNGGEMTINGNAFVYFGETTAVSADYSTSMRETLQAVNAAWYTADGGYTYTETQMNAVKALCDKYAVTQSWELNNIYLVENTTEPEQTVSEV